MQTLQFFPSRTMALYVGRTFLVRTLTVPAIATLLRQASWWPQHTATR